MKDRKDPRMLLRLLFAALGACSGWCFYLGAAWIVYHDSINYRLPNMLSGAAETARAIGPIIWTVVGLLLALPLLLGCLRRVISFWLLVGSHLLIYLLLVCALGSISSFLTVGLFAIAMLVWAGAIVMAFCACRSAQPDAAARVRFSTRGSVTE
jgi:hypothetical protein